MIVLNSSFTNTTSRYSTVIFSEEGGVVSISKSRFKNLVANKTAGAVAVKGISVLELSDCEFDNVSSANNGGAIFVDCNAKGKVLVSSLVNNTNFTNCSSDFGGAILQLNGHLIIISSIFHSNSATYEGGAVYTSFADLYILNSKFISNNVEDDISYGGACYFDNADAKINGSDFINNTGSFVSTIFSYGSDLELGYNRFICPSDVISIYSVYGEVELEDTNILTNVKLSLNNTNHAFNFEGSPNPFTLVDNPIVFDEIPPAFDLRIMVGCLLLKIRDSWGPVGHLEIWLHWNLL